jgi:hypothetical protein
MREHISSVLSPQYVTLSPRSPSETNRVGNVTVISGTVQLKLPRVHLSDCMLLYTNGAALMHDVFPDSIWSPLCWVKSEVELDSPSVTCMSQEAQMGSQCLHSGLNPCVLWSQEENTAGQHSCRYR